MARPVPGHPVQALAAELAVLAEVDGGVRGRGEDEYAGVPGRGRRGQPEALCYGVAKGWRAGGHGPKRAQQFRAGTPGAGACWAGGHPAGGHEAGTRYVLALGLSGRMSQGGRRSAPGDPCPAGRVSRSHSW